MKTFYIGVNTDKPITTDLQAQLELIKHEYIDGSASYQYDDAMVDQLNDWQAENVSIDLTEDYGTDDSNQIADTNFSFDSFTDDLDETNSDADEFANDYLNDFDDEKAYLEDHTYAWQVMAIDTYKLFEYFTNNYPDVVINGIVTDNPNQLSLF